MSNPETSDSEAFHTASETGFGDAQTGSDVADQESDTSEASSGIQIDDSVQMVSKEILRSESDSTEHSTQMAGTYPSPKLTGSFSPVVRSTTELIIENEDSEADTVDTNARTGPPSGPPKGGKNPMARFSRFGPLQLPLQLAMFSVPAGIGLMVQNLYSVADIMIVGHSDGGANAIAGISLYFPIEMTGSAIAVGIGIGTNAAVSRYLGAKKPLDAASAVGNAYLLGAAIAFFLPLCLFFALTSIFNFTGADSETLPHALDYGRVLLPAMGVQISMMITNNLWRACHFPIVAMISTISSALINVSLDLILILGFGMGTRGCAIATVTAQAVPTLAALAFFSLHRSGVVLRPSSLRPAFSRLMEVALVGAGLFASQGGVALMAFVFNIAVAYLLTGGDVAAFLAATSVVGRILMLCFVPIIAVGQGVMPLAGFSFGARQYRRLASIFWLSVAVTSVFAVAGTVFLVTCPKLYTRLFTTDQATIDAAVVLGVVQCSAFFTIGFGMVVAMMLMAIKLPQLGMVSMVSRHFVAIPLMLIMAVIVKKLHPDPTTSSMGLVIAAVPLGDLIGMALNVGLTAIAAMSIWRKSRAAPEQPSHGPPGPTEMKPMREQA